VSVRRVEGAVIGGPIVQRGEFIGLGFTLFIYAMGCGKEFCR